MFVDTLIPLGIWGGLLLYPPLQFVAWRRLRGRWRTFAALPATAMIPVLILTALGWFKQSNLWPILLIFVAPPALLYLIVLMILHRVLMPPPGAGVSSA